MKRGHWGLKWFLVTSVFILLVGSSVMFYLLSFPPQVNLAPEDFINYQTTAVEPTNFLTGEEQSPYYDYGKDSIINEEFKGLPKPKLPVDEPYFGKSIDVDNDGKKEIVFYTLVAMTQRPHKAYIVKDNLIIFESDTRPRINLLETPDHNGFYLQEYTVENTPDGLIETTKTTRYKYVEGKFVELQ